MTEKRDIYWVRPLSTYALILLHITQCDNKGSLYSSFCCVFVLYRDSNKNAEFDTTRQGGTCCTIILARLVDNRILDPGDILSPVHTGWRWSA